MVDSHVTLNAWGKLAKLVGAQDGLGTLDVNELSAGREKQHSEGCEEKPQVREARKFGGVVVAAPRQCGACCKDGGHDGDNSENALRDCEAGATSQGSTVTSVERLGSVRIPSET